jgi:hypothetical protein
VTLIAKLALVGMAFHAGILKAYIIYFSRAAFVLPDAITDHTVSPLIQQFHVLGPYV